DKSSRGKCGSGQPKYVEPWNVHTGLTRAYLMPLPFPELPQRDASAQTTDALSSRDVPARTAEWQLMYLRWIDERAIQSFFLTWMYRRYTAAGLQAALHSRYDVAVYLYAAEWLPTSRSRKQHVSCRLQD